MTVMMKLVFRLSANSIRSIMLDLQHYLRDQWERTASAVDDFTWPWIHSRTCCTPPGGRYFTVGIIKAVRVFDRCSICTAVMRQSPVCASWHLLNWPWWVSFISCNLIVQISFILIFFFWKKSLRLITLWFSIVNVNAGWCSSVI